MLGVVMARTILPSWQTPADRRRTRSSTGTGRSPSPTAVAPATPRRTPSPPSSAAVELGYRYLETDVHVTADGVLVAFHDDDLQRTCGMPGRISELPWSQVATARCRRHGADPEARRAARHLARRPVEHRLQGRGRGETAGARRVASTGRSTASAWRRSRTGASARCGAPLGSSACTSLAQWELVLLWAFGLRIGRARRPGAARAWLVRRW